MQPSALNHAEQGPPVTCVHWVMEQVAVVQFSNDVRVEVHPRNLPLHELRMRLDDLVSAAPMPAASHAHARIAAPCVISRMQTTAMHMRQGEERSRLLMRA